MSTRRLRNIAEQADGVQREIQALEKLVQLKDKVNIINDNTVAQQSLFPSSLELWKQIVAAQIRLYKLRERERQLRKEYEKEQNRIIDFSVLDKYRRFKRKGKPKEGEEGAEEEEEESVKEGKRKKKDLGFMIRFRLANAYEAIRRQEQVLSRPHLPPFVEKATKAGPVYFFYDRDAKEWKRFYPDNDKPRREEVQDSHQDRRLIDGRGLPFFMQQRINKINARPRHNNKRLPSLPSSRRTSVHNVFGDARASTKQSSGRFPSASVPSQLVPSRDSTFIAPAPSSSSATTSSRATTTTSGPGRRHHHRELRRHREVIEETTELLTGLTMDPASPPPLSTLPNPDEGADLPTDLLVDGLEAPATKPNNAQRPRSKQDRKKVERLKMVASRMNALQEELEQEGENEEERALEDDEEMFKNCRYLYRLCNCRCIGKHSELITEEIRKQVAGTIDLLDHTDEGEGVGTVDCLYCMATPRAHVSNWLTSLQTGSTTGVYGDPRYNWFPKLTK